MTLSFPLPASLRLLECQPGATMVLRAAPRAHVAYCPLCQRPSRRVHSRYWRTLTDLPLGNQPVCLKVRVRRFFCLNPHCRRHLFAEQLPDCTVPHAQRTTGFTQALIRLAQVVGSRPGGRLAHRLALSTSATTLLRLERAAPLPLLPPPRVLGVDDWAFRKGHHYGTLLYDHERHQVVDLLPDRTTKTLAQWLKAHPGVEIVTRDRAEAYAEGIREGAPQAKQVADRWHIVKNLGQVLERLLEGKGALIRQANVSPAMADAPLLPVVPPPVAVTAPKETRDARLARCRRQQRLERYDQVHTLHEQGLSQVAIASRMQIDRRTVGMFLRVKGFPERKERAPSR
jgi:transposase